MWLGRPQVAMHPQLPRFLVHWCSVLLKMFSYFRCSVTSEVFSVSTLVSHCSPSSSSSSSLPAWCGSALYVCIAVPPWRHHLWGRLTAPRSPASSSHRDRRLTTIWTKTTSSSCLPLPSLFRQSTAELLGMLAAGSTHNHCRRNIDDDDDYAILPFCRYAPCFFKTSNIQN